MRFAGRMWRLRSFVVVVSGVRKRLVGVGIGGGAGGGFEAARDVCARCDLGDKVFVVGLDAPGLIVKVAVGPPCGGGGGPRGAVHWRSGLDGMPAALVGECTTESVSISVFGWRGHGETMSVRLAAVVVLPMWAADDGQGQCQKVVWGVQTEGANEPWKQQIRLQDNASVHHRRGLSTG